jgi:hypothetical protein
MHVTFSPPEACRFCSFSAALFDYSGEKGDPLVVLLADEGSQLGRRFS